jgi:hypothetical protein
VVASHFEISKLSSTQSQHIIAALPTTNHSATDSGSQLQETSKKEHETMSDSEAVSANAGRRGKKLDGAASGLRSTCIGTSSSAQIQDLPKQASLFSFCDKPIFEKAALKSQKGAGLGRLSGNSIGGDAGRKVKRNWEASALAMPWPLSEVDKERLRTTYVQGYDALDIEMTRKQATQAVKNLPKKFNGTINVSLDVFFYFCMGLILILQDASMKRFQNMTPSQRAEYDKQKKFRITVCVVCFYCSQCSCC